MVQATDRKLGGSVGAREGREDAHPSRKEKPLLPQPDPSVTLVKTQVLLCLFGVKINNAMQMQTDAITVTKASDGRQSSIHEHLQLMGANHRMILCRYLDDREQMTPMMIKVKMARRTI